jgi:putative membrane-bound dehydrogenase-like protein
MRRIARAFGLIFVVAATCVTARAADNVQWIWSPAFEKEAAPKGSCYFRKTFNLTKPEQGEIQIGGDDSYELFINGRRVGGGENWKKLDAYDVTKFLVAGSNVIAVRADNTAKGSAGLVARVIVKQHGDTHVSYSTDSTWKTTLKEFPRWQMVKFNDSQWLGARAFGALGATLPWGNEVVLPENSGRFRVLPKFQVEWLIEPKETGPLIAMTFDEFGQILAARENGPILLISDGDKDGMVDTVSTFCEDLKNCQGLLCVNGQVFAVGEGPEGTALYRLSDEDHDGKCDREEALLKFTGQPGEHGPHGLTLGPDGLIYMIVGNFAHVESKVEKTSPHHHYYEGDLVTPRYEDSGGHAVGIKAPGGTVLRTDVNGAAVELVAGGLQNPYDLAFNAEGELFTADSDMEWDLGMSWYRPTRVVHVVPGGEYGWRSGWAKWPDYYLDSLPPMVEMGRGSPTGIEVYNHVKYPARYHDAVFVCDWSRGRIMAVKSKPNGGSYKATSEVFLEGRPLNVTDIAVGPDGWLYFCTGGRGTEGGVYRVVWEGKIPPKMQPAEEGLAAALDQPQINSAWARQRVALIKQQLGSEWTPKVRGVLLDVNQPVKQRVRALELMQLFGPYPSPDMLANLCEDKQASIRAKAAYLLGVHGGDKASTALSTLLSDEDGHVQRTACEALARAGLKEPDQLLALLESPDRYVASAARRALQIVPTDQWEHGVLDASSDRAFINGAVALLALDPGEITSRAVLGRSSKMLKAFVSDEDFVDLMRVIQLALAKSKINGAEITELRNQLVEEYPSQDEHMNRELVRLLVYLQAPTAAEQLVAQLSADVDNTQKLHAAIYARFLTSGWNTERKLAMLKFFEDARSFPGGHSYAGMVENVSRDFFMGLTEDERQLVLADGAKWPTSALSVLAKLPEPNPGTLAQIRNLDRQVKSQDTDAVKRLRTGIVAVLGMSKDPASMAYLRELWQNEPDRRVTIAIGLAQDPQGENWPLLVRSLSIVEGSAAQEVLLKLAAVDRKPVDAEAYRQVILRGLILGDAGSRAAIALLEKWAEQKLGAGDDLKKQLAAWQEWFATNYPDAPSATLTVDSERSNWTFQELLAYLTGPEATPGDAKRGAAIFEKGQCIKCHAYGERGERVGPDLSTVSQRFQKKEVLESILFPSHVISDQYAAHTVTLNDGRVLSGMVSPVGDGSLIVLDANGQKVAVNKDEIESTVRNKVSSMPEGLLNKLTIEEVADLFAYLNQPPQSELAKRPAAKPR